MFYSVITGKPLRLNRDLTVDGLGEEKDKIGKNPDSFVVIFLYENVP